MINVGIMSEDEDYKLVVKMGSKKDLKVRKDEVVVKLCKDTVEKHSDRDQFPCRRELCSIIPRSEGGRQNSRQSR